jgi:hypothetical protein
MNVKNIWIVNGKKFDNRAYLLIASVDPLIVFYRMGHLRFSVLDYKGVQIIIVCVYICMCALFVRLPTQPGEHCVVVYFCTYVLVVSLLNMHT